MVSRFIQPGSLEASATSQQVQTEDRCSQRRRFTLPSITNLNLGHKLSIFRDQSLSQSVNSAPGVEFPSFRDNEQKVTVLKVGVLFKTSLRREEDARPGPTRQRQFRLTEGALEYLHHFSSVKVKRSFPLTSVETVDYDESSDPKKFHLTFSNSVEMLQAQTVEDASDWIEKIVQACVKWHTDIPTIEDSSTDELSPEIVERCPSTDMQDMQSSIQSITRQEPGHEDTLEESHVLLPNLSQRRFTCPHLIAWNKQNSINRAFSLEDTLESEGNQVSVISITKMNEHLYSMTKYPRHKMFSQPTMKLFKLDIYNMQIMWKRNQHSRFHLSKSLSLHKVVEIREGQRTETFERFPFERAKNRSFSLIYQKEDAKYVHLESLDLISHSPQNSDLWINDLKSLIRERSHCCTYPKRSTSENDCTDTTILWLRQIWSCKVDRKSNELPEKDAIKLAKKLNPHIDNHKAKRIVKYTQLHRVYSSCQQSLDFSMFLLTFNLLHKFSDSRLFLFFLEYAKTSPRLGLTLQEFKDFLIAECYWQAESCTKGVLRKLMQHHDSQHQAYKKYAALNKPADFAVGQKLLSFAGFISFLRSKDNSAIDTKHETVYQDMTQPLSHYFINSSHNTYLEGDQLKGKSSTDAYVRALLQGCRCVEIDCWDDTSMKMSKKEPIIYHGYTLTTKLPFNKVIQTIKDYALLSSKYPVIVSTENHCNKTQQAKMAKAFRDIFKEMLPRRDLVELQGRERLPSPEELQGKIILKGSYIKIITREASALRRTIKFPKRQNFTLYEQPSRRVIHPKDLYRAEYDHCDCEQEAKFTEAVGDLKSLIIYAKATSIKPWDWRKQKATTVTQMFSFNECKAGKFCTNNKHTRARMLACTERQLVRTYPKGTRVDSSNYNPLPMWSCGIQMVALNYQYPDIPMHLNQGFFRQNGGCGYVLKPAVMRREDPGGGSIPFDPEMNTPHPDVLPIELEIELFSGQRLCHWKQKCSSTAVTIETYGITHDCTSIRTPNNGNVVWPYWEKGEYVLRNIIYMPELCMVYFRVETDKKVFAQNCVPVVSLKPGIKFIPLRTPGGELIPGSGLFVKIKKTAAAVSNTSDEDTKKTSLDRRVGGEEIAVADIGDRSYCTDEDTTLSEDSFESDHCEKGEFEEQLKSTRRRYSTPASLTYTNGHSKRSVQVNVIAEVNDHVEND